MPALRGILQDALLEQGVRDLILGNADACATKIELLVADVGRERACAVLCLRLFYALSTGMPREAANIAYYVAGGFARADGLAALGDMLHRLADWRRLSDVLAAASLDGVSADPAALLDRLAARAEPVEDPAWSAPQTTVAAGGPPPLVVITLINGMGNQIFQYAAALRRARQCGGVLKLDLSLFSSQSLDTRPFGLAPFTIDAPLADSADLARVESRRVVEDIARFDPAFLSGDGDCGLLGCWGLPIYFRGVETELRDHLRFRDPAIGERAAASIERLRRREAPVVGLHVRRGDYLRPDYRNSYAPHPVAYYRAALQRFPSDSRVVVFSDMPEDREWCARTFADLGARMEVSRDRSDIEDFALLAACDHQIISTSSFGWWAAWLNRNPRKQIVAPHPGIGLGPRLAHIQLAGRLPAEWCVLCWDDIAQCASAESA